MSDTRDLSEAEKWVRDLCGYDDEAFRLLPLTAMEQSIANAARARIAELEEAARRYFNADGSVSLMVSAEAVVEARKAAALRIAELEAQVRERDAALRAAQDFARFGSWAFEQFWSDGEPGDIDASDAQEKAIECGLLGRTSEVDPNTTHAEGCDYSPGADALKCCCFAPTRRPLIGGAK